MNEAEIFEALDQARRGLRECLGELEAASPSDPKVGRSFSDVQLAFERLGDLEQLRDRVPEAEQAKLRSSLEELLRLNALLSDAVKQDRERLVSMIRQNHRGMRSIQGISTGEAPAEGNCDVSA